MGSFFTELKRRNVFRICAAYLVSSWLIIQVAETIFPLFGFGDNPARVTVILLAIGFPIALVCAWFFEFTSTGLKLDKDVDPSVHASGLAAKKMDRIIIFVLLVGLGYFSFDKFVLDPARDSDLVKETTRHVQASAYTESFGDNSIAVLPFLNMSGDEGNEYFSDGITEELLNLLARIPELRVISRTSVFSYKGKDIKVRDIANELNVSNILEGSVRKSGNNVRITVQLIDAGSDTHLWSETYDRTLDDIFEVQDEIASIVVDKLKVTILGDLPTTTEVDPGLYMKYLQAEHMMNLNTKDGLKEAIDLYSEVTANDPNYAPAWIGLSVAYSRVETLRYTDIRGSRAEARVAVEKAREISPENADVYEALAWDYSFYENNYATAAENYAKAISLSPNDASIYANVMLFLMALGRMEEALSFVEYAISRDPANATIYNTAGFLHRMLGKNKEARYYFRTAQKFNQLMPGVEYEIGASYLAERNYAEAESTFSREPVEVFSKIGLAMSYYANGNIESSDSEVEDLVQGYGEKIAYYLAVIEAFRGKTDEAYEWLYAAREIKDTELYNVINEPLFASIKTDPRWPVFLESIGKSPEQLAMIQFEAKPPEINGSKVTK